jgi:hypothetical protein
MLNLSPFPDHSFGEFASRLVSFFRGAKTTDVISFFINFYMSNKSSRSELADAFISSSAIFGRSAVLVILRGCCGTQVFPFIIRWVTINVVDFVFRPSACHVKPSKTVSHVLFIFYAYLYSSSRLRESGQPSSNASLGKCDFPLKQSGGLTIMQDRSHVFGGKIGVCALMSPAHFWSMNPVDVFVKWEA